MRRRPTTGRKIVSAMPRATRQVIRNDQKLPQHALCWMPNQRNRSRHFARALFEVPEGRSSMQRVERLVQVVREIRQTGSPCEPDDG